MIFVVGDMSYSLRDILMKWSEYYFFVWCAYCICKFIDDYFTDEITDKIRIIEDIFFNEQ